MATKTPIVYCGVEYTTAQEACNAVGLNYGTLMCYVSRKKVTTQEAFDRAVSRKGKTHSRGHNTVSDTIELPEGCTNLYQACRMLGLGEHYGVIRSRIKKGLTFQEAITEAQSGVHRRPKKSRQSLGLPLEIDGFMCRTSVEVSDALGISNSALIKYVDSHKCDLQAAVEHYKTNGIKMSNRAASDLIATRVAYTGTDGKRYFYALCAKCLSFVLVSEENVTNYRHETMCSVFSISRGFVPPNVRAYFRSQCPELKSVEEKDNETNES